MACPGLNRSVVTAHGLMRGFARDLGMAPAKGLDGTGASPTVGSQAMAMAKSLSPVSRPIASAQKPGSSTVGVFSVRLPVGRVRCASRSPRPRGPCFLERRRRAG